MDKPKMIKAMKASISEVLEQMFFLPIDVVEAHNESDAMVFATQRTIAARVGFDGPCCGTFSIDIPSELAASITADFLGTLQDDLLREQITGTVKEMLNMLAGNCLSAYDPQSSFNLKIPELVTQLQAQKESGGATGNIDIGIETMDSRMTLHMTA